MVVSLAATISDKKDEHGKYRLLIYLGSGMNKIFYLSEEVRNALIDLHERRMLKPIHQKIEEISDKWAEALDKEMEERANANRTNQRVEHSDR